MRRFVSVCLFSLIIASSLFAPGCGGDSGNAQHKTDAGSMLGTWSFTYTLKSTWTSYYGFDVIDDEESNNEGQPFIRGLSGEGELAIVSYYPSRKEWLLRSKQGKYDLWYRFQQNGQVILPGGAHWFTERSTGVSSREYAITGEKVGVGGIAKELGSCP